jgi:hypothetical protein
VKVGGLVNSFRNILVAAFLVCLVSSALAQSKASDSLTVVYRDHREKTVPASDVSLRNGTLVIIHAGREEKTPLSEVARIEVHDTSTDTAIARSSFVGKWEVGMGGGAPGSFRITLDRDGRAHKNVGGHTGTWSFVDGEARIEWSDGWRDVIAKVGNGYEKRAYEHGKAYSDPRSSVSSAKRANDQSI